MENIEEFLKEFEEEEDASSGQPYWILFALPAFFFMWFLRANDVFVFRLAYSALAAIATIVLCTVVFVWIPNDQMRKIERLRRFANSKTLIDKCRELLGKIKEHNAKDRDVIENGARALATIQELVRVLKLEPSYQGIVENNLVPGLSDYLVQINAWRQDQTGASILAQADKEELYILLTKKDELFNSWRLSSGNPMQYLTSKFRSQNQMQSAGINPQTKE